MQNILLISEVIMLAPFIGGAVVGLFGKYLGDKNSHIITILGVGIAAFLSLFLANLFFNHNYPALNQTLYNWLSVANLKFQVGVLLDSLTVTMLLVVNCISMLVHIYSIGYMDKDPGYSRFFCYMSLFTFAMNTLVLANNGLQLFFGWEGVGVVSYLLISFWYTKSAATAGGLKAFLVNRVGDLGFLLGLALCLKLFGSLDYNVWFAKVNTLQNYLVQIPLFGELHVIDILGLLLFIGAMGKSAQVPLHVWLPESMEGPTPISALIHAATMVTAGVYMVSRLSPIFELSAVTLNFILIIGSTGALFLGLIAIVQNDIKRVVAYSTLSQLGYMIAATGASAYSIAIFHLVTHACFKALLFLGAGSVIVAMHHEQDMRKMGGLRKYIPITFASFLIGSISLAAIPPFAGFFSKDSIINAVHLSNLSGAGYAYFCLVFGAFVTAFYSFRAVFMTFYGREPKNIKCHESPATIIVPLIILAIPSVIIGWFIMQWVTSSEVVSSMSLANSINTNLVLKHLQSETPWQMVLSSWHHLPFWLSLSGIFTAWFVYIKTPYIPTMLARRFNFLYNLLINKYGIDDFNNWLFVDKLLALSNKLFVIVDRKIIDTKLVHGLPNIVCFFANKARVTQTGFLYHYTSYMGLGILLFIIVSLVF